MHSPAYIITLISVGLSAFQASTALPVSVPDDNLPAFYQPSTSMPGRSASSSYFQSGGDAKTAATNYFMLAMNMTKSDLDVTHSHTDNVNGMHHVYFTQMYAGLPIANAVSNVAIMDNQAVSSFSAFVPNHVMESATPVHKRDAPIIPADQAVLMFAKAKGLPTVDKLVVKDEGNKTLVSGASFAMADIVASQAYYQTATNLVHVWDLKLMMHDVWQNAFVDTASGAVVGVANWTLDYVLIDASNVRNSPAKRSSVNNGIKASSLVKRATTAIYNVIPIGQRNPEQNNGLTAVKNPADSTASPDGWHVLKGKPQTDLKGNNVIAQSNPDNVMDIDQLVQLTRPQNADLNFNFQFDPAQSPTDSANRDAATVNMFYVANSMHDILFNYGFDEAAGNFQDSNASGQGQGNDPVIANSQDGSGTNNANFASGPDGMAGLMRMYVFTQSSPSRDGALENDIVSHEITHGLSTRLTGGAANANCLTTTESGGLGEGWSDTFGMLVSLSATATRTTDFASGFWAVNNPNGVRRFPYSTNMQTNPHTYGDLDQMQEVHQIGEVWATMLFEAMWNLVDAYGLTPPPQLAASAKSGTGNTVLMALLIAGMKIQPCNPTFVQARDAILVADKTIQGGKDACLLWTAFAKRGLGAKAVSGQYMNSFDLPAECASPAPTDAGTTQRPWPTFQTQSGKTKTRSSSKTSLKTNTKKAPKPKSTGNPDPMPAPQPIPTTLATGNLAGKLCQDFGGTQCSGGTTFQCAYVTSQSLTWTPWFQGPC